MIGWSSLLLSPKRDEAFAFKIDWAVVHEHDIAEKKLRPWVRKKVIEYLGTEEASPTTPFTSVAFCPKTMHNCRIIMPRGRIKHTAFMLHAASRQCDLSAAAHSVRESATHSECGYQ